MHSLPHSVTISGQQRVSELSLSTSRDRGLTPFPDLLAYLYMTLTVEKEICPYWETNAGPPEGPSTLRPSPGCPPLLSASPYFNITSTTPPLQWGFGPRQALNLLLNLPDALLDARSIGHWSGLTLHDLSATDDPDDLSLLETLPSLAPSQPPSSLPPPHPQALNVVFQAPSRPILSPTTALYQGSLGPTLGSLLFSLCPLTSRGPLHLLAHNTHTYTYSEPEQ